MKLKNHWTQVWSLDWYGMIFFQHIPKFITFALIDEKVHQTPNCVVFPQSSSLSTDFFLYTSLSFIVSINMFIVVYAHPATHKKWVKDLYKKTLWFFGALNGSKNKLRKVDVIALFIITQPKRVQTGQQEKKTFACPWIYFIRKVKIVWLVKLHKRSYRKF